MIRFLKYNFICGIILLFRLSAYSQESTINLKNKKTSSNTPIAKHNILLIPFEPRLYLGEIDYAINRETKLSAKEIKNTFRDGVDDQLYKKLKSKFNVVSLLDDTVKTKKDLEKIYQHLSYDYQKVPDQTNYNPPKKEKDKKTIDKGQVVVETNNDKRFMNAKVTNASLIPYLYGKYKSDLFLFVNELDIKAISADYTNPSSEQTRKIIIHYTVYTHDAKEINSGIADIEFPNSINTPSKILSTYISQLAETITYRVNKALEIRK